VQENIEMPSTWQEFSKELTEAIAQIGKSIVAVDGRSGHTSSGIVWRSDSIVTAAHTIRHETGIRIVLEPGQVIGARLLGRDRGSDIAVLKLETEIAAPPVDFASSTSLAVGDFTVAVARTRRGNIVASTGVISGLMGEWQARRTRIDQFIRPDLNLYPGFSGGALVGPGGKVIGLNTLGLLRDKPITIPSSTLTRIAEEIASKGHLTRAYIGLAMQPVQIPESLQKRAGVSERLGLLVMHVEPGGPADNGGTLLGDVLVSIDGNAFDDLDDVHQLLDRKGVDHEIRATLIRGGSKIEIGIKLGARASG
jgi:S1-C subfamily serine protease